MLIRQFQQTNPEGESLCGQKLQELLARDTTQFPRAFGIRMLDFFSFTGISSYLHSNVANIILCQIISFNSGSILELISFVWNRA